MTWTPTADDDRRFLALAIEQTRKGRTDAIEKAGRLPASVYRESVLYTTSSPCIVRTGTALLYEILRIVVGENRTFEMAESLVRERGSGWTRPLSPSAGRARGRRRSW